jgi:hypothetical protein
MNQKRNQEDRDRDIGLLLRQRASHLREQLVGEEPDDMRDANLCAARELESLAVSIEQGAVSEAPLPEAVWHHEVRNLNARIEELEEEVELWKGKLRDAHNRIAAMTDRPGD